jgi:hypothetical protein
VGRTSWVTKRVTTSDGVAPTGSQVYELLGKPSYPSPMACMVEQHIRLFVTHPDNCVTLKRAGSPSCLVAARPRRFVTLQPGHDQRALSVSPASRPRSPSCSSRTPPGRQTPRGNFPNIFSRRFSVGGFRSVGLSVAREPPRASHPAGRPRDRARELARSGRAIEPEGGFDTGKYW